MVQIILFEKNIMEKNLYRIICVLLCIMAFSPASAAKQNDSLLCRVERQ